MKRYCQDCISYDPEYSCCRSRTWAKTEPDPIRRAEWYLYDNGKSNPWRKNEDNRCLEYKRRPRWMRKLDRDGGA